MRFMLVLTACLAMATAADAQGRRGKDTPAPAPAPTAPLAELLARIPVDAQGEIYLTDLAASRRQIAPLIGDAASGNDRLLLPWAPLLFPPGLGSQYIARHLSDPGASLGMSPFEFGQLAGWGQPPDSPVIVTGVAAHAAAIEAALADDGLTARDVDGVTVWHVRDDFQIDFMARSDSLFGGDLGMAQRFAIVGDLLLHARSWPTMHRLLDPGATLAGDPDAAAIAAAAYALPDAGEVLVIVIPSEPPLKMADPSLFIRLDESLSPEELREKIAALPVFSLPSLPPYTRYGLVLWQEGRRTLGAVVIPYIRDDTARTARDNFAALFAEGTSPTTNAPFREILPYAQRIEIVGTGDRHVLVLGFAHTIPVEEPVTIPGLLGNPLNRLFQMYARRELPLLIGF